MSYIAHLAHFTLLSIFFCTSIIFFPHAKPTNKLKAPRMFLWRLLNLICCIMFNLSRQIRAKMKVVLFEFITTVWKGNFPGQRYNFESPYFLTYTCSTNYLDQTFFGNRISIKLFFCRAKKFVQVVALHGHFLLSKQKLLRKKRQMQTGSPRANRLWDPSLERGLEQAEVVIPVL